MYVFRSTIVFFFRTAAIGKPIAWQDSEKVQTILYLKLQQLSVMLDKTWDCESADEKKYGQRIHKNHKKI